MEFDDNTTSSGVAHCTWSLIQSCQKSLERTAILTYIKIKGQQKKEVNARQRQTPNISVECAQTISTYITQQSWFIFVQ